jgi:hypothetical protein
MTVFVLLFPVICCKNSAKDAYINDVDVDMDAQYDAKLLFEEKTVLLKYPENTKEMAFVGKIELKDNYGTPNYGENPETDAVERYYFFIPNDWIILEYNFPDNKEGGLVKEMQIVADPSIIRDIYNSDYIYEIKGSLFMAHTGHHHSPVLIQLNEINIIPGP